MAKLTLLDMRAQGAGGGGAPIDATFITQTPNGTLTNEQALSLLATGLLKSTTVTGIISIAVPTVDYASASQGALADTSLQPADIGISVQAWDIDLDTIAALVHADGNFIVSDGAAWTVESGATARASLGLGTLAVINSPLPIANGGSGQTSQQAAIDALTAVAGATDEYVLTKDTISGNAIWKVAAGGSSLPVADTQTIVMGSADNTKLLRFEVDGFTAGATRVMTPPNQDATLAGLEVANIFTADQTFSEDIFQADGKTIGIGTVTPQTFFHKRAASGVQELRIDGSNVSGRIGLWESAVDDPTNGIYLQYAAGGNYFEMGTRDASTIDIPRFRLSKSAGWVIIRGDMTSTPGGDSVVIGRDSRATHARAITIGTGNTGNVSSTANDTITLGINGQRLQVITATGVGFGTDAPGAKIHGDQSSVTGAIPVLTLDQADVDEDFISFIGTSSISTTDQSLIKPSDFPTPGVITAWFKCKVTDTRVGGIGTIDGWIPVYAAPI